jgi:hypothetical protein
MIKTIFKSILITAIGVSSIAAQALPPSSSEYVTDPQTVYNNDDTTDTFNLIKIVACFIKNTKPELQAGKGKYVAWVGSNSCDDSNESPEDGQKFEKALIESGTNSKDQLVVRFWLESQEKNWNNNIWATQYYYVNVVITAGVNIAPPLGNWSIHFCKVANTTTSECDSLGFGQITPTNIKVFQKETWDDGTRATRQGAINYVLSNGEIQTGKGSIEISEDASKSTNQNSANREVKNRFAFKEGFYLSRNFGKPAEICYDRVADNGLENVWETWLYNPTDGKRIKHNSGMSIKKSITGTGNDNQGWASYWGIWFPEDKKPLVESTVYADAPGQTNKPYKMKRTVGSVYKNTIKKGPLSGIAEVPLGVRLTIKADGTYDESQDPLDVRLKWVANGSVFQVLAVNGVTVTGRTLSFEQLIRGNTIANNWTSGNDPYFQGSVGMNQEGTSNWYQITLGDGSGNTIVPSTSNKDAGCVWNVNTVECNVKLRPSNDATFLLSSQVRVLPGTQDAKDLAGKGDLVCTGNCFQADGTHVNGAVKVSAAPTYQYNPTSGAMSIVINGNPTPITKVNLGDTWGHMTEALLASTDTSSLNAALCTNWYDPATNSNTAIPFYCGWNLREASNSLTYYSYQLTKDNHGDAEYLLDESTSPPTPLLFDQPINTRYTVVNQLKSPLNGKEVNIQYQGNGQLNLPGHCFSRSENKSVDCGGSWSNDKFYINDFIVPPWAKSLNDYAADATKTAQATLINLEDSNKTYLTKWLRKSVIFNTASSSSCSGLSIPAPGEITLPGLPDWSNPALSSSPTYIGPWQSPSGNPLYVDGVLQ